MSFAAKAALRKSLLKTISKVTEGEIETQSRAVYDILSSSPFYSNAKSVGCYLSMQTGELRTEDIVNDLLSSGKKLYTPYLPPKTVIPPKARRELSKEAKEVTKTEQDVSLDKHEPGSENPFMEMLRLYTKEDRERCPLDKWNLPDPGLDRLDVKGVKRENVMDPSVGELDLILLPAVAFDEECNRLGRGKAFYDRFLTRYTETHSRRPLLVAIGLTPQMLPPGQRIPTTPNDFQLDAVVSPLGLKWRKGLEESR